MSGIVLVLVACVEPVSDPGGEAVSPLSPDGKSAVRAPVDGRWLSAFDGDGELVVDPEEGEWVIAAKEGDVSLAVRRSPLPGADRDVFELLQGPTADIREAIEQNSASPELSLAPPSAAPRRSSRGVASSPADELQEVQSDLPLFGEEGEVHLTLVIEPRVMEDGAAPPPTTCYNYFQSSYTVSGGKSLWVFKYDYDTFEGTLGYIRGDADLYVWERPWYTWQLACISTNPAGSNDSCSVPDDTWTDRDFGAEVRPFTSSADVGIQMKICDV